MDSGKYSGGSPAKIDWRVTEVRVGTQANAVESWNRHAGSPASRLFSQQKPLVECKTVQHQKRNLGQPLPCPLAARNRGI